MERSLHDADELPRHANVPTREIAAVKITLTGEDSIRLEPTEGPLTIEAPTAERQYSPFHMLASSLAYCTFSVLVSWATHADLAIDGMAIDVAWAFSTDDPKRVADIALTLHWPSLAPQRLAAAKRVAAMCTVHTTLLHPPRLAIEAA